MFEFKQGIYTLGKNKLEYNKKVIEKICKTAVAISNLGRKQSGYIFIGISDNESSTKTLMDKFDVKALSIYSKNVVGIDWELNNTSLKNIDSYLQKIISEIESLDMDENIKSQLRNCSILSYQGHQIIKIEIKSINDISLYSGDVYRRVGAKTEKVVDTKEILSLQRRFVELKN